MNRQLEHGIYHPPGIEREKMPLDVTLEHLPRALREQATEQMLQLMRGVLKGLEKYAIFASTGMYLQGKRLGDEAMQLPPGDLDVAVADEATLRQVMERLQNVQGVIIDHDGIARPFPGQEAKVLGGKVLMKVGEQAVEYPFEFFFEQRIVNDDVFRHREKVEGLNVLKLEGLKKQYLHNLEFDSRLARAAEDVAGYLARNADELQRAMAGEGGRDLLDVVLRTYDLDEPQLQEFFALHQAMPAARGAEREQLQSAQSRLLAGVKTKVAKRLLNVQQLQGHLGMGD